LSAPERKRKHGFLIYCTYLSRKLNEIINLPSPAGKGDRLSRWMRGSDGDAMFAFVQSKHHILTSKTFRI
jgi:hypothetical protein